MPTALAKTGADLRAYARNEVHYRARGFGPDAQHVALLLVNFSASGLMARVECDYVVGDKLRVTLPVVGAVVATIRWSLGGRIGCEFERPIDLADYHAVLAAMTRGR